MKKYLLMAALLFLATSLVYAQEPTAAQDKKVSPAAVLMEVKQEIAGALHDMHESLEVAVDALASAGVKGEASQAALDALLAANKHAFDCSTMDPNGVIATVAPKTAGYLVGMDISRMPHVQKVLSSHEPAVSTAIDTREGFTGFDLMHPLVNKKNEFIGVVSILTEPEFFGHIIDHRVEKHGVSIWIMQKNGRIIYDTNKEEIGLNLFSSMEYASYTDLQRAGKEMVAHQDGKSSYLYLDDEKRNKVVKKEVVWTTIELHGTEFRLAVSSVVKEMTRQELVDMHRPSFLFVQSVSKGSREADRINLTLHSDQTIYFTDRPDRITGHMATGEFVSYWDPDDPFSFTKDPPNAAISIVDGDDEEVAVVELLDPVLKGDSLSYKMIVLDGEVPAAFEKAFLFIDCH